MLKKYNGIYSFQLKILIFFLCIYLLHFEACYEACQTCYNESRDLNDMKCINCKNENFSILNGPQIVFQTVIIMIIILHILMKILQY